MELGGQILENKQRHDELADQMRQVEAVIKMLDPAYNLGRIAVKRRTEAGITMKLKRGTFSATFFLACIAAMELEGVVLEEI